MDSSDSTIEEIVLLNDRHLKVKRNTNADVDNKKMSEIMEAFETGKYRKKYFLGVLTKSEKSFLRKEGYSIKQESDIRGYIIKLGRINFMNRFSKNSASVARKAYKARQAVVNQERVDNIIMRTRFARRGKYIYSKALTNAEIKYLKNKRYAVNKSKEQKVYIIKPKR